MAGRGALELAAALAELFQPGAFVAEGVLGGAEGGGFHTHIAN